MSQYINEAFKKFRLLEDFEEFSLTPEGLDNLGSFMGQALDDEAVDVFDLEAEAQEDLKKSYVGKVICDCNVCHSNIFYDKEDIVIDDDGIVNAEDECPYCMSTDGYTIIGEIKEWAPGVEDEIEDELSDEELADEPIEIEDEEETEVVEESLKRKSRKRKLTESSYIPTDYEDKYISKKVIAKVTATDYDEDDNGRPYTFKLAIKEYEDGSLGWEENGGEGYANMPFDTIEEAVENYKNWADNIYGGDFTIEFAPKFSYLSESLKLDGVKSLRGVKGLKKRPEKAGVKAIRGIGDSKISGTTLEESISKDDLEDWLGEHETATKDIERFYKKSLDKLSRDEMLDWIEEHEQLSDDLHRYFNESIEDVTINTEDETMTMTTKEDGGVVVETSPKQSDEFYDDFDIPVDDEDVEIGDDVEAGDEVIAPISDETEDEIMGNSEEDEFSDEGLFSDEFSEEEIPEEENPEEEDVEVGEFDEETFDGLGESYLRRCYDNVNGYKTTQVRANNNTLIIEGVISFKSGSKKKTNFVFESKDAKNGKYIFEGYNAQINNGKPVFKLNCSIKNKTIVPTSFKYNYTSKNALNESVKLSGTVKAKRK